MANTTGELQVPRTKRVLGFTQKMTENQSPQAGSGVNYLPVGK